MLTTFLLGAFLAHHQQTIYEQRCEFYHDHTCNVRGTVTDIEDLSPEIKQRITIAVHHAQHINSTWEKTHDYITLYTTSKHNIKVSDQIELDHIACTKPNQQTHNILKRKNIVAHVYRIPKINIIKRPQFSFARFLHTLKHHVAQRLRQKLCPEAYNLFSTIFLGKRITKQQDAVDQYFSYWGLNHYLARAGLHLALIFLLINILTSLFMIPATQKALLNLLTCTTYYCLSWTNIPFVRAFTVIAGQQLCTILSIPINTIHLLNLTFLTYLLYNPLSVCYLDTQLTFAITYAILFAIKSPHLHKPKHSAKIVQ